ncbi:hypothetical protein IWW38_006568, partial [Coemansia aciculifera]
MVSRSTASLSSLKLVDIPPHLAWETMDALSAPFPCLKRLALVFGDTSTSPPTVADASTGDLDEESTRMVAAGTAGQFPSLSSLSVRHCPFDVRRCLSVIGMTKEDSRRLAQFEVHGSKSDILTLPAARSSASWIGSSSRSVTLACVGLARHSADRAEKFITNALTSSTSLTESLSLTVISSRPINFHITPCLSGLRSLELRVPMSLASAETLMLQMPRLLRLCLPYIATEVDLLPCNRPTGRVLSRSVQLLAMGFWDCRQDLCAMSMAVVNFVAAIPSLLTLIHDSHVAAMVRRLIAGAATT